MRLGSQFNARHGEKKELKRQVFSELTPVYAI